tara:strand:+ start:662 stop:979 length:318 start_codon:yes stop_codon:yes gene_type:complete
MELESTTTSLCIPRIHNSINKDYIYKVFCKLKIGYILKVKELFIKKEKGDYKRIIIHLKWNTNTENGKRMKQQLEEGKTIKVVYQEPWYWKILEFNNKYKLESNV